MARRAGLLGAGVGAGLRTLLARRIRRLSDRDYWAGRSAGLQREALRSILRRAAATDYGGERGFERLSNLDDASLLEQYRRTTPVQGYDALRPLLERMRVGAERDLLWPGLVRDWAQTSGTTAGDKYVPVSKDLLRHNFRAALDIYAHAARAGISLPRLFSGRILFLGGSSDLHESDDGVRTGDLSGVVTRLIRWPLSSVYLPGKDIALMSDWPAKIDAMARRCAEQDVRGVNGMPSWTIALMERVLELRREQGRPAECIRDVWPNLTLLVHGGTRYDPFRARIAELWSGGEEDVPNRIEVYAASEAFVGVSDTPGDPSMRLNVDLGVFYEFVPLEQIDSDAPEAFTVEQVETGRRYVVVLTTPAGLYRYNLGDVVEFDQVPPDGPARLRIVGRSRLFINAFGENLIVEHIENAVVEAAEEIGLRVGEFTAAPVYPGPDSHAGLELAIEWGDDQPQSESAIGRFREVFDGALKRQSNDYAAKRSGGVGMAPPRITRLSPGAVHRWMASIGKLGGQHKCPRCANHREIVGALREMEGVSSAEAGQVDELSAGRDEAGASRFDSNG